MVSILGDYNYTFPKPIKLEKKLKDMLEDNVDEKYYLSDKQIKDVQSWNAYEKPLENMEKTDKSNISPTLTTRSGAYAAGMILVKDECIGTYQYSKSDNFMKGRDRLQLGKEASDTLQTTPKEGVVINPLKGISGKSWQFEQQIYDENGSARTLKASEGSGNIPKVVNDLRIRKLTPYECFALMGVKKEDYLNCAKNQSDSSLYHLAGDSIVVDVLCHIFKQLIGGDKE